jgi:hypothetical protein
LQEQAKIDTGGVSQALKDLLIPGVGPYNAWKRVGTSIRGPELEKLKHKEEDKKRKEEKKPKK